MSLLTNSYSFYSPKQEITMHELNLWIFGSEEAIAGARMALALMIVTIGWTLLFHIVYDWLKDRRKS